MKESRELLAEDQYWSVVLPNFCRFNYLLEVLDSLDKYADMPYEVILHDDHSRDGSQEKLFAIRDRFSSLIFNNGDNFGLGRSADRAMQLAHSKYILFLNTDCVITIPCLKAFKDILDRHYIGIVYVNGTATPQPAFKNGDTYFGIKGSANGSAFVLRKDVWADVGGWDYEATTGISDSGFIYKLPQKGYFTGHWIRPEGTALPITNPGATRPGGNKVSTTSGFAKHDNAYPKLFKFNLNKQWKGTQEELNQQRHSHCLSNVHRREGKPRDNFNMLYWCDQFTKIIKTATELDWNYIEREQPQFLKWKGMILNERRYSTEEQRRE